MPAQLSFRQLPVSLHITCGSWNTHRVAEDGLLRGPRRKEAMSVLLDLSLQVIRDDGEWGWVAKDLEIEVEV